jgi:hypothetical protein
MWRRNFGLRSQNNEMEQISGNSMNRIRIDKAIENMQ